MQDLRMNFCVNKIYSQFSNLIKFCIGKVSNVAETKALPFFGLFCLKDLANLTKRYGQRNEKFVESPIV